ncbi:MAG: RNase adapter RapZ [Deltaproteobacteria bacterium]|nr:RNase adapter RapZ [Deltaproteobacteria bacterium]
MSPKGMSQKRIVVLTGLAGAGKTTAARALEDIGYFVVDNLPPQLIETLISLSDSSGNELKRIALVIDAREARFLDTFSEAFSRMQAGEHDVSLAFLDCDDDELVKRFKETRRRHPQAIDGGVRDGIRNERVLLEQMSSLANAHIDTTQLSVHELKENIQERFGFEDEIAQRVTILSFGFKHGLPSELDLCFDVRFLQNPYFNDELRPHTGLDQGVQEFVLAQPGAQDFLTMLTEMVTFLLPRYQQEGKRYVTVAIGCTGGQHRSVCLVEALGARLAGDVRVRHRDLDKRAKPRPSAD